MMFCIILKVPNVSPFHLTAIPTVSNTTSLIADCVCVKVVSRYRLCL